MHAADFFRPVEVGECARHAQHAMVAARGQPHRVGCFAQERESACIRARHIFENCARDRGIAAQVG